MASCAHPVRISIVLPTSNELSLDYLPRIIAQLQKRPDAELIVVDNASDDGTAECAQASGGICIDLPASNRAQRLNAGIERASGDIVLLHHPRTLLDPTALDALATLPAEAAWGAFSHRFDLAHPLLRWTSWYSNHIRLDRKGVAYLDHCPFIRRAFLRDCQVPDMSIFEDTALSRLLRRLGRPLRLPQLATTSAIRYQRNGVWRQAAMNQLLKLGYAARLPHAWMNGLYEKGLSLNG